MKRKVRYRRRPCPGCGEMITTNALGRASHERACKGGRNLRPTLVLKPYEPKGVLEAIKVVAAREED